MLKRGLILLVFLLFLPIVNSQDSCLVASEENVPIVAQRILDIYSRLPNLDGDEDKIVEAALDSLERC